MKKGLKTDYKNFFIGLLVVVLYFITSLYSDYIFLLFKIDYTKLPLIIKLFYNLFIEIILIFIIVYLYKKRLKKDFKDFKKNKVYYFKNYIKYWILTLGLIFISNSIIKLMFGDIGPANQQSVINSLYVAPIYTFITTVIIAPLLEELVFRLSIRKMIAKSDLLFIIVSGLFFGSLHVVGNITYAYEYLFIIPYSIPGFIFAYTLIKSKNIFVPISLHFIHNGICMAIQILLLILK